MEISSQTKSREFVDDASVPTPPRLRFMRNAPEKVRLIVISVIIGIIAGIAAAVLKWLVEFVVSMIGPLRFSEGPDWSMLWLPIVGILLTGIYQRYILHDRISHGVDKLVNDLEKLPVFPIDNVHSYVELVPPLKLTFHMNSPFDTAKRIFYWWSRRNR